MTRILNRLNVSDVSPAPNIPTETPPNNIATTTLSNISSGTQNIPSETISQQTTSSVINVAHSNNNRETTLQNNNTLTATTSTSDMDNVDEVQQTGDVNTGPSRATSIHTQSSVETEV